MRVNFQNIITKDTFLTKNSTKSLSYRKINIQITWILNSKIKFTMILHLLLMALKKSGQTEQF